MPRIEGIEKSVSCIDALLGKKPTGKNVIVVGGLVGCEIAFGYAREGKTVTIVEALDELMKTGSVPFMNKVMLLDGFEHYGVRILTGTRLQKITDPGAVVTLADGTMTVLKADTVIMAVGFRPLPSMKDELEKTNIPVFEIGDGKQVGNVLTCIKDAYETAEKL